MSLPTPQHKQAVTSIEINELLKKRYSPKAFSSEPISEDEILKLQEAARWAPSSGNSQPWRFLLARNKTNAFNRIMEGLDVGNRYWCQYAPVLILTIGEVISTRNGKEQRYRGHDIGQATSHLTFQAAELGIYVHQMAGFNHDIIRLKLNVPANFDIWTVIALGKLGTMDNLTEKNKESEQNKRTRLELNSIWFEDSFV